MSIPTKPFAPSDILLTNKVAVITGGGGGIGQGIALAFARFGADVVIADKNPEAGESTAAEVEKLGRRGVSITTDVRDFEQVQTMVDTAVKELGRIDILVNNAGGTRMSAFLELGEQVGTAILI